MSNEQVIVIFSIPSKKEEYAVSGYCNIAEAADLLNGQKYWVPQFRGLTAENFIDNQKTLYRPEDVGSLGRHLDIRVNMVGPVVSSLLRADNSQYEVSYICPQLKELIDLYSKESLNINGKSFPKRLLHKNMRNLYHLYVITDEFAYYKCDDDDILMVLDNRTMKVVCGYDIDVSEDYCLLAALKNTEEGKKENLIWKRNDADDIISKYNIPVPVNNDPLPDDPALAATIERLKKQMPEGARIKYFMRKESRSSGKLIASEIPCGTPGSVIQVYDNGSILVNWEGKHSSLIHYGIDLFELA